MDKKSRKRKILNAVFSVIIVLLCAFTLFVTSDLATDDGKNIASSSDIIKQDSSGISSDVEDVLKKTSEVEEKNSESAENTQPPEEIRESLPDAVAENSDTDIQNSDDISFMAPVYGKIIKDYYADIPVYSKTMSDWRVHRGVDIYCEPDSEVYCSADGTVASCSYDVNMGYVLTVKSGDYTCTYAALSDKLLPKEGDEVKAGQIIGCSAEKIPCEAKDGSHIHFEIKKGESYVNPRDYITFES